LPVSYFLLYAFLWVITRRLNSISTFRNTLFYLNRRIGVEFYIYPHMKMEHTDCSETSEYKIQTLGNYPEKSIQHSEHGESLKSRISYFIFCLKSLFPYVLQLSYLPFYCIWDSYIQPPFSSLFRIKFTPKSHYSLPSFPFPKFFIYFVSFPCQLSPSCMELSSHATLLETRQLPVTSLENATQALLPHSP
jgi:hypothetical protein